MAKFNRLQSSFRRGLLSKRFLGATDLEDYFQGVSELRNMYAMPQGGLKKRPGTKTLTTWNIVEDFANPGPYDYRPTLSYFYADVDSTMFALYYDQGFKNYAYDLAVQGPGYSLPESGDELEKTEIQTSKFGKDLVLVSAEGKEPVTITRFKEGDFPGAAPAFSLDRWFLNRTVASDNSFKWFYKTPYGTSQGDGLLSSIGATNFNLEMDEVLPDVDLVETSQETPVRFEQGGITYFASIDRYVGFVSSKHVYLCSRLYDPASAVTAAAVENVRLGVWGKYIGFPRTATAFQQRSNFGGTDLYPDTLFGSAVSDSRIYITPVLVEDAIEPTSELNLNYNVGGSVKNTDPFVFNIASAYDTKISWINGGNVLYAGKLDEERIATGYDDALGPLSVSIQKKSSVGGGAPHSVSVDQGVFFITSDRKNVAFLVYNERNGQSTSVGSDAASAGLVDELGKDTFIKKIVGDIKNSIVYVVMSTGELGAISFNDSVNNFAWTILEFDFSVVDAAYAIHNNTLQILARYEDTAVLTLEELDLGSDYLEHFKEGTDNYAITLDGCSISEVAASGTITGFERFADRVITMLSPELGVSTHTVSALGEIVLPEEVSRYQIGIPISAYVRTMNIASGAEYGATNGRPKRFDTLSIDVLNSYGGEWSSLERENESYDLPFKEPDTLFTGTLSMKVNTVFSDESYVQIDHDITYPFILLTLTPKGVTYYD